MNHLHLLDRIKKLDIATLEKMSPEVMARLTNGFDESLVRNVLYIGTTNNEQRIIIRAVKNAYRDWKKDTHPFWGNPPMFPETYPQYLENLQMDIECGLVVTTEGSIEDFGNKIVKNLTSNTANTVQRVLDALQESEQTVKDENIDNIENEEEEIDDVKQEQLASASDNDDSETLKRANDRIKELEAEVASLRQQLQYKDSKTEEEPLDFLEEWQKLSARELAIFFSQALGVSFDPKLMNKTQLANLAAKWTEPEPDSIRTKISGLFKEEKGVNNGELDGYSYKTKDEALNVYYFIMRIALHFSSITPQMNTMLDNLNFIYNLGIVEKIDENSKEKQITKKEIFDTIDKSRKSGEKKKR